MYVYSTFPIVYIHVCRPQEEEDASYAEELEVDGDTLEETNTIFNDSEDDDDDEMEEG